MQIIPFQDFIRRYYSGEGFVVFDTETTGLNTYHDDIVEIGAVTWKKGESPKEFNKLLKINLSKMTDGARQVNQITDEEILAADDPTQVLQEFMEFCGGNTLLAHNIRFDYDILNNNLVRYGLNPYPNSHVACSLQYSKDQQRPGKLSELAKSYRIKPKTENLHRALYDVQILCEVMDKMMKEHEPQEMQYSLIF